MGKISNIGVTNFDTRRLKAIIDSGVKVVSSQVQYSLLDRRVENLHSDFCKANNIKILPFGVLAGSFLTDRFIDRLINFLLLYLFIFLLFSNGLDMLE